MSDLIQQLKETFKEGYLQIIDRDKLATEIEGMTSSEVAQRLREDARWMATSYAPEYYDPGKYVIKWALAVIEHFPWKELAVELMSELS